MLTLSPLAPKLTSDLANVIQEACCRTSKRSRPEEERFGFTIGDFVLDASRRHHGLLVVLDGLPVAFPDSSLTIGYSFLRNFKASLTSFCLPLFGTLSLHSKSFSESRVVMC